MSDILQFDLLSNNSLSDKQIHPCKYMLVKNLEQNLINENHMEPGENNVLVVDAISFIRLIPMGQLFTFQDLLNTARKHIKGLWKFKPIDIVYYSYVDDSLKKCERLR